MDIQAYFRRVNYQGSAEPTLQVLQAIHEAHMLTVPFENLSIHYKQPIILRDEALFDKVIQRRRGGFCYELNGLFAWLLHQIGFQVTLLSAGVSRGDGSFGPEFDHLTLLVHQLAGSDWLADVGFGDSFREPLRFEADVEQDGADGRAYRLRRDAGPYWILQQFNGKEWESQYRFTLQPHELPDYEEMCHYQQTSPESHFTQKRVCSLATPEGRITLSDMRFITTTHGKRNERILTSQEEYTATLAERFGIIL